MNRQYKIFVAVIFVVLLFVLGWCYLEFGKRKYHKKEIAETWHRRIKEAKQPEDTVQIKCTVFYEDSLRGMFTLLDSKGVETLFGDLYKECHLDDINNSPDDIYVLNKTKETYLKLTVSHGAGKNEFGFYEVGFRKELEKNTKVIDCKIPAFITSKGIQLGMQKDSLLSILGNWAIVKGDTAKVVIDETNDCNYFSKKYNMPLYRAFFILKKNKLCKYGFGFDEP